MKLSGNGSRATAIQYASAFVVAGLFHLGALNLAAQQAALPQTIQQSAPNSVSQTLDCKSSKMTSTSR